MKKTFLLVTATLITRTCGYPIPSAMGYPTPIFALENLKTAIEGDTIDLTLSVKNTGQYAGKEVVQVYVGKGESAVERPEKELKAFQKSGNLLPDTEQELRFRIPLADLSYWNETQAAWVLEPGEYYIQIGTSSRNILLSAEIVVSEEGARVKPQLQ